MEKKMEIRLFGEVVEFIFGPSDDLVFDDEGQPGLEIGYDEKSNKKAAFLCYDFLALYRRILQGLEEKPVPGKFSVEAVEDYDQKTPICDPRVKDTTLAEIVQWVWEKYYSHVAEQTAMESAVQNNNFI